MGTFNSDEVKFSVDQAEIASTGNIYEAISVISKRANSISQDIKAEIDTKVQEFTPIQRADTMEDTENPERIALSRHYERKKKPCSIAISEWMEGKVFYNYEQEEQIDMD